MSIIIDPEFKDLIPPLSLEEFAELEASCIKEGIRDALITWPQDDGNEILIDGHNRFEISAKHAGIQFDVKHYYFSDRNAALIWMVSNQFARRNLSAYDRSVLALKIKPMFAERAKKQQIRKSVSQKSVEQKPIDTQKELATIAGVSHDTIHKVEVIENEAPEEVKKQAKSGEMSINQAYKAVKAEKKKEEIKQAKEKAAKEVAEQPNPPEIQIGDSIGYQPDEKYDLLLTDPPYSTDVDDIGSFAHSWLPNALRYVKDTGFAYVFIGAYPDELRAYLNIAPPENVELTQLLIWTYKNTLGNNPANRYKQNYQACLFYRGVNAPKLNCPQTSEQWAVQEINAPDGRQGDREHAWQKPMEIAERFIRHTTEQGQTVFDPFACTGTFLLAAAKLGRKAYGFEINPENAKIAERRGCLVNGVE